MWSLRLAAPWLIVTFPRPVVTVGWTPQGAGRSLTQSLLWREVRDEDLCENFDVDPWLAAQTAALGHASAPCFLTSARIKDFATSESVVEGFEARVIVTAGLGNAERIGSRRAPNEPIGTINAALWVNAPLSEGAVLEALSLLTEARTTAMLEDAPKLWPSPVTGTGTDCLALCFEPSSATPERFCGKHTALGEAIGKAALQAFGTAITKWAPAC